MKRIVCELSKVNWPKRACAILALCVTTAMALPAQTVTTLLRFQGKDGGDPHGALVQATNGDFYGTTYEGGANHFGAGYAGTVFKISPSGTITRLYSFCAQTGCADGAAPEAGLVQATNGDFYGTTGWTVFKITPGGTLTTLYTFCSLPQCADGEYPAAALIQGADGDFYGTTTEGGGNFSGESYEGTVFKITPTGTLTTLHSFCADNGTVPCLDGFYPQAALVQAANGDLYGTTSAGGTNLFGGDGGTVFKITPSGTLTTLYNFCSQSNCADGAGPTGLVQGADRDFYGTTSFGGSGTCEQPGCGTVFKITANGTLTTLYSFCSQAGCAYGGADGGEPVAALVQATDGNFYGTTDLYGANCGDCGTVFKITPSGTLTTLYSFCPQGKCTDGKRPNGLVQATNGDFYGTTANGGGSSNCDEGCGAIFSLSVGLGPFVKTQTTSGKVGAAVTILGTDLTGATSITFNGAAAAFTVVQPSEIKTTVPVGATTGTVQVATPGGTLSSNVPFRVP
jgi:uncharacterized repeat protein (TIGR03803 family)